MESEDDQIINQFKQLKARISGIFEISKTRKKGDIYEFVADMLPFYDKLEVEILSLPHNSYLLSSIDQWIVELNRDIKAGIKTGFKALTDEHYKYRIKLRDELYRIKELPEIKESINTGQSPNKSSTKQVKRSDFNQSKLNESETALLMLYMRENGVFLKDISDTLLAECFGKLTGFQGEQLRQLISGKSKVDKHELSNKKGYYDNILALLNTIIDKIRKESSNLK